MTHLDTGKFGSDAGVVSAATREPIDVKRVLEATRAIENDEQLAHKLVNIAIDVDKIDVDALLRVVGQIKDELWRARTIFSVFRQMRSSIVKELPEAAQDAVVALVGDISGEGARVAALRNLSSDLPHALRLRLADLGKAIADPLCRLQSLSGKWSRRDAFASWGIIAGYDLGTLSD